MPQHAVVLLQLPTGSRVDDGDQYLPGAVKLPRRQLECCRFIDSPSFRFHAVLAPRTRVVCLVSRLLYVDRVITTNCVLATAQTVGAHKGAIYMFEERLLRVGEILVIVLKQFEGKRVATQPRSLSKLLDLLNDAQDCISVGFCTAMTVFCRGWAHCSAAVRSVCG